MAVKNFTQEDVSKKTYDKDMYVDLQGNTGVVLRLMTHLDKFDDEAVRTKIRYKVSKVWKNAPFSETVKQWGLELPVLAFEKDENAQCDPMTWISNNNPNAFKNAKGEAIKITSGYQWQIAVQATEVFPVTNKYANWDVKKFDFLDEPKILKITENNYSKLEAWYLSEVMAGNDPTRIPVMYTKTGTGGKGSKWEYDFKGYNGGPANVCKSPMDLKDALSVGDYVPYSTFGSQVKLLDKIGIILPFDDPEGTEEESEWGTAEEN